MRIAALVLVALVVWLAVLAGPAGSKTRKHAPNAWTLRHKKRQHERLAVVRAARDLLGVPYVFGGSGRGGVDCSGLTAYAYRKIGMVLPHLAAAQARLGRWVSERKLRPGDLLIYHGGGHVALYVGHGQMIHASSVHGQVVKVPVYQGYFVADQARRLIG